MHPLTCYAGQISLCHAKIEKISEKIFVMIDKDGGGGQFLDFMGGHSCYEGGHRAHGGSPLTRENPATGGDCILKTCEIPMESIKQVKMAFFFTDKVMQI